MWKWILGVLATVVGGVLLQLSTNFLGLNGGGGGGGHEMSGSADGGGAGGTADPEPKHKGGAEPPTIVMGPLETGVNRQGNDFDAYGKPAKSAPDCAELCRVDEKCDSVTYVIPTGRCWLKKGVPAPTPDPNMVSSIKDRSAAM